MNKRNELLARVYIVMTFFVFLAVFIVGKVFYINFIEGEKWRNKISHNVKWKNIEGDRGNIYDMDGNMLAITSPIFEVRMDILSPSDKDFKENIDSLSFYISKYLRSDKSQYQWKKELEQNRKLGKAKKKKGMRYFLIKRNVTYDEFLKVKSFPLFRKGQHKGGLIDNSSIRRTKRLRPYNQLARRTIGIDRKNATKVGLEGAYDNFLKGETTKILMKKVRGGTWIPLHEVDVRPLTKGSDIITNLNIKIQDIVHTEVMSQLMLNRAEAGVGIIMEVKTGKIVAMANLSKNSNGSYVERENLAITRKFAPGSVMKTATTMALLEDGYINTNTLIDIENGRKVFRGKTIRDDEDIAHGNKINLWDVFVHSSNVGMAKWADQFYNKNRKDNKYFVKRLKDFGLNAKSEIDLKGEIKPVIKNSKDFNRNTIPWMAHGYEMELTPLQVLTFYNAIANNGKSMTPYLVDKITSQNKTIENKPKIRINKIANDNTIKTIQELLEGVVTNGTGSGLKKCKIKVAGKTGTAQVEGIKSRDQMKYNSTFAGYFPADNPKYSMIITTFGNKNTMYYASKVAVPVFKRIVDKIATIEALNQVADENNNPEVDRAEMPKNAIGFAGDFAKVLKYVEIPYKRNKKAVWSKLERAKNKMDFGNYRFKSKLIPNVKGMGARDAIYLLENYGLKVEIEGYGKVVSQSIPPNTKRNKQKIKLILK